MNDQRIKQIEDERLIHKAELEKNVADASLYLEEIKVITADTHTLISEMLFLINKDVQTNEEILSLLKRIVRKIGA